MQRLVVAMVASLLVSQPCHALCSLEHASDLVPPAGQAPSPALSLNEAYPDAIPTSMPEWRSIDFHVEPQRYADLIKVIARSTIKLQSGKVLIDKAAWWSAPFMNYTRNGREHYNGLTKERTPRAGDLAPASPANAQVWAIGWYNAAGAYQLGKIWADLCDPDANAARLFPEHTMSVKMLFTTAAASDVPYLVGSPEVMAAVDPGPAGGPVPQRVRKAVRLLQMDFAVKDDRSSQTGWVFGTFAWVGPPKGDGLWDNLQLVGVHWGNDPDTRGTLQESWINTALKGTTYGWPARPFMGFEGRLNGPADNMSSSCLSCHARAQLPRAAGNIAGQMPDLANAAAVATHLSTYFENVHAGQIASPVSGAIPLDYSLQVMNAWERQCAACAVGDLSGTVPKICRLVPATADLTACASSGLDTMQDFSVRTRLRMLIEEAPPRQ